MNRVAVESSNIRSVGYDELTETLEVEFKGGSVYQYLKVPKSVFASFMGSESKGSFFHANIRTAYEFKNCT